MPRRWFGCAALGLRGACLWLLIALAPLGANAETARIAVAANFMAPMRDLLPAFERETGHKVELVPGATGALYAQIRQGAPFDVFLSADEATARKLVDERYAVEGSGFTYAIGRLALWSASEALVDPRGDVLRRPTAITRLALANPRLAPYGAAAMQVMHSLGVAEQLRPKLVQGESIAQTYQFVASGNAALGFVALSQVMVDGTIPSGSAWVVPAHLHTPLRQDAVLLARGKSNPAALALLSFLRRDTARMWIARRGYGP